MSTDTDRKTVYVAGDAVIDWNTALKSDKGQPPDLASTNPVGGGAWLQADIARRMLAESAETANTDVLVELPPASFSSLDDTQMHSHLLLEALGSTIDANSGSDDKVWRVTRKLGYKKAAKANDRRDLKLPERADVVLLDDADFGFRDDQSRWPKALWPSGDNGWILYKMSSPVAQGALWDSLAAHRSRTIAVVRAEDVRHLGALISRGISWERTCEELAWEMRFDAKLAGLAQCACTVVLFPWAGAFVYDTISPSAKEKGPQCRLVFDPRKLEGQWEESYPGTMIGATSVLTGAIARELVRNPSAPDLDRGIRTGLETMRQAYAGGFDKEPAPVGAPSLTFPLKLVPCAEAAQETFQAVEIPRPWGPEFRDGWTLLETAFKEKIGGVARHVVREGLKQALAKVPVATFGKLSTADRSEIESYNAIRALIEEFLASDETKPLSIAVFGPPGAGKSFGIKQIADGLSRNRMKDKEFNLSQFGGPGDLLPAFHEVRDIVLSGKLPLIFWDEFDTSRGDDKLFWLKYFLMPMQDGKFREGALEHPLGKCIFVFAGGTSPTFRHFCDGCNREPASLFRDAKGPDFVSRLRGHMNVLGPNPRLNDAGLPDPDDRFVSLRRAILLRSIIDRNAHHLIDEDGVVNIDETVLNAFLNVSVFKHGVRSMESLVTMSRLGKAKGYESSCLPQSEQIAGHVDAAEFLEIVQHQDKTSDVTEMMAKAVHEVFRKQAQGPVAELSYEDLPPEYKASNRAHAKYLEKRLVEGGLMAVPMRGSAVPLDLPPELLEKLAIMEHDRWNEERAGAGWKAGYPKQEPPACITPYLVPWEELPERISDYDRDFMLRLPETMAPSGYTIKRISGQPAQMAAPVRPATRIGVLGHGVRVSGHESATRIRQALAAIRAARGNGSVELVSSLVGPAECLVARVAMEMPGTTLRVPMPMPYAGYMKVFDTPESQSEIKDILGLARQHFELPKAVSPDEAYRQAGEFVVDDCDILIVLWDGIEIDGWAGMSHFVASAIKFGREIVWIPPMKGQAPAGV